MEKENQEPMEEPQEEMKAVEKPVVEKPADKETQVMTKLGEIFREYHLSTIQVTAAQMFFTAKVADPTNERVARLRQWMLNKINGIKFPKGFHDRQKGCPDLVPGLRSQPFWDTKEFPWVAELEANYETIRDELLALRGEEGFQPYRAPSWTNTLKADDKVGNHGNDKGNWNVFYLFLHNMRFTENCSRCPKTVKIIENVVPREYQ